MDGWSAAVTFFDTAIGQWLFSLRSNWLTALMLVITSIGSTGGIVGMALLVTVVGLKLRKRWEVLMFNLAVLGAFGISEGLKALFHRARPPLPWLGSATGYSFPSGHSLLSLTLYGFLAVLVWQNLKPSRLRSVLGVVFWLLAVLTGISRIYLGVHFPSDVLGGWVLAVVWIGICRIIMGRIGIGELK